MVRLRARAPAPLVLLLAVVLTVVGAGAWTTRAGSPSPSPGDDGLPARGRQLGLAVRPASGGDWDRALADAVAAGVRVVEVPVFWRDVETAPGALTPEPDWAAIAAAVYAPRGVAVTLSFVALDTTGDARPEPYREMRWDDPAVIEGYWAALERTLDALAGAELAAVSLGNEVDVPFAGDAAAQREFAALVETIAPRVRAAWPDVPVGVKVTAEGLLEREPTFAAHLLTSSDVAMVTYYPLDARFAAADPDVAAARISEIVTAVGGAPLHLSEIGYPSGDACGGSEARQAAFVEAVFDRWDAHRERIPLLLWVWQTDLGRRELRTELAPFPVVDRCFREFFATLGLRDARGRPKAGWRTFVAEAQRRGFGRP